MAKVLVALSGGVDSSVALALLKSKGFDLIAATMYTHEGMENSIEDAKKVCIDLGIEHVILDYREIFREEIEEYFIVSYFKGITPNPCVRCNEKVKFGFLIEEADKRGCDFVATGHYLNIFRDKSDKKYKLKKSKSGKKDQTYFLYRLNQYKMSRILTVLGKYKKSEIRKIAEDNNIHVAEKKDSQEICFVKKDYVSFIKKNSSTLIKEGNFIDKNGKVLGKHKGIVNYTIGQRKGLNIALGKPVYVIKINVNENSVVLGDRKDCFKKSLHVKDVNLMYLDKIEDGMECMCKIRSAMKEQSAKLYNEKDGIKVIFDQKVWAPTPGQSAVFYDDDIVIGGGIINTN